MNSLQREQKVLLCGGGGFAGEVIAEFRSRLSGVYDPKLTTETFEGLPVFRSLEVAQREGFQEAVIAVGHPRVARRIEAEVAAQSMSLAPAFVSERAILTGDDNEIGDGSLIMAGTILTNHVRIGKSCVININCTVGHGARLGDFVSIMPLASISGLVTLEDDCYLGSQVFVTEGVSVAARTTLGAQAGVFRNIEEPDLTWIGSPARHRPSI